MLDELHSLVTSKRGVLLSLALSRVADARARGAPHRPFGHCRRSRRAARLARAAGSENANVPTWCSAPPVRRPQIRILKSAERVPWAGHSSRYAIPEIYAAIKAGAHDARLRQYPFSQAEMTVPGAVDGQ